MECRENKGDSVGGQSQLRRIGLLEREHILDAAIRPPIVILAQSDHRIALGCVGATRQSGAVVQKASTRSFHLGEDPRV